MEVLIGVTGGTVPNLGGDAAKSRGGMLQGAANKQGTTNGTTKLLSTIEPRRLGLTPGSAAWQTLMDNGNGQQTS
jgi:hypothetical protein